MGRNTKWVESQADDPVELVARRALSGRLDRLWRYLELSVTEATSESENVHQLRVFTRRTAAAMEIFAGWLPKRRGRWMDKQLKRLRKAAGEARDLDVLTMQWQQRAEAHPSVEATLLVEQVKRRRRKAQWPVDEIYHHLSRKNFSRRARKFWKRVRLRSDQIAKDEQKIGRYARVALGKLVRPYLQAAALESTEAEALHAFRIQAKQVRYAMEIFAGAFDADFRQTLYPVVAALQDQLGAINDHVTAQQYLESWRKDTDSCAVHQAIDAGLKYEREAFEKTRREFLDSWTAERRDDLARQFARYVDVEPQAPPADAGTPSNAPTEPREVPPPHANGPTKSAVSQPDASQAAARPE